MTVQPPKHLINNHPSVDLGKLEIRTLKRGVQSDIRTWVPLEYPVAPIRPSNTPTASFNWNGYIETLRLNSDGTLSIVEFEFPSSTQHVDELIPGDFFLTCSEKWGGPCTFIPFTDGRIVDDRAQWIVDYP